MVNISINGKAAIFNAMTRAVERGYSVSIEPIYGFDRSEAIFILKLKRDKYCAALLIQDEEYEDWAIEQWLTDQEIAINTKIVEAGNEEVSKGQKRPDSVQD